MRSTLDNNMLMHGFILVTILATAKGAEAEITMEAAFQGHCGHTSPCEQLCYEIHDGMYECDCIEGYELNKNGYSCQVINSTLNGDGHSKSDEDVLYQKGVSFSVKLASDDNVRDNQVASLSSSSSSSSSSVSASASASAAAAAALAASSSLSSASGSDEDTGDADIFFNDELEERILKQRPHVNTKDYHISPASMKTNQNPHHNAAILDASSYNDDVPEFEAEPTVNSQVSPTSRNTHSVQARLPAPGRNYAIVVTVSTAPADSLDIRQPIDNVNTDNSNYNVKDMSIYDDVNNNQLNLRPLARNTYQSPSVYNLEADASPISRTNSINQNQYDNTATTAIAPSSGALTADREDSAHTLYNENISNIYNNYGATFNDSCNLECGTEGLCHLEEKGPKCLCPFGKTGHRCSDELKVRVPKFAKRSWLAFSALRGAYKHVQIRIEFRPESFDGVILLSGERDDLTGDFMALLLNKGFVEFWFDCGSGEGSVRSKETIRLNEWNSVIIYRHRWDAWLLLNHGTRVQGRSNGLFSRITFREPVFLGGTGNVTGLAKRIPVNMGFVGCIRRFVANEHNYRFEDHPQGDVIKGFDIQDCVTDKCFKYPCQHGGKCLPSDQGAMCLCPIGFVGDLCEMRMDLQVPAFNGSSFLRYAPLGDSALIWLELKVILKPENANGIVLYSGTGSRGDFIALSLEGGYVEFTFELGSGPALVRSRNPITIGQWHTIRVSRTARLAVLKIDNCSEVMTISTNGFWHLSLPHNLFVGGVNHVDNLPTDLKYKQYFVGCIQRIEINGHDVSIISEALGGTNIANCPHACVARPCSAQAHCVPNMEDYECRCNAYNGRCHTTSDTLQEEVMHADMVEPARKHVTAKRMDARQKNARVHGEQLAATTVSVHKKSKRKSLKSEEKHGKNAQEHVISYWDMHSSWEQSEQRRKAAPPLAEYTASNAKHSLRRQKKAHRSHHPSEKHDARHKDAEAPSERKLPMPPPLLHYESLHVVEPQRDLVTFDEMVQEARLHEQRPSANADEYKRDQLQSIGDQVEYKAKSHSFADVADTFLDGRHADADAHNEQLVRDMERIMTNTNSDDDQSQRDDRLQGVQVAGQADVAHDNLMVTIEGTDDKPPVAQAHTDWSVLKRFEVAGNDRHIGVKKNFGACFVGSDSYFHYNDAETMSQVISYNTNLNLRIKTHSKDGVILWTGRQGTTEEDDDYLSLGIENGYLHFRYDLGSGEVDIKFNMTKVSDGLWHRIRAIRDSQEGYLEVDGRKSPPQCSPGRLRQLNTDTGLYVGGMPDVGYFTHRRYTSGIVGCISEIVLAGELKLNFDPNTLGTAHNVETGIL